jgi:hypothetical protein
LEEQSESKGISPTFSKPMVKRIGVFQKFVKTKQKEVKIVKILQDRSKTNVCISNCVEEEKRKNQASFFWRKKANKNEYNPFSIIKDLPLLASTNVECYMQQQEETKKVRQSVKTIWSNCVEM